ncbi:MAG: D-sedoheptulose 7-phosphate isomerase [Candidatus Eisenbacteria bacterium]|nr:D-sedoheptulose 7-phosphate isomerase [Candidatus Eisenbacteria bacterium]
MPRKSQLTRQDAENAVLTSSKIIREVGEKNGKWIMDVAQVMVHAVNSGKKILFCGNGGSAADAQHLAAELSGKFYLNRDAIPAVSLTTNTSILTAVGNDLGFEKIFSRQLEAMGARGDVLVAITTSGKSENIIRAVRTAKKKGLKTVCLTGLKGRELARECDFSLIVPSEESPRIQEAHITVGHTICWLVEAQLFGKKGKGK